MAESAITIQKNALSDHRTQDLETLLLQLCHCGKPALRRMGQGWYCGVEMHVAAAGTSFDVKSEFNCATPIAAVRQCAERILTTLNQWT